MLITLSVLVITLVGKDGFLWNSYFIFNKIARERFLLGSSKYLAAVYHPVSLVLVFGKLCKHLILSFLLYEDPHRYPS